MKNKCVFLFLLCILLSCGNRPSHKYDAIKSLPSIQQALQNNGSHFEFVWQTRDSLLLYAQGWQPDTLPRAILCLVHGLGEHSGRYIQFAEFLVDSGFAVLTFDLRGHGKSQGQQGHFQSYKLSMSDLTLFIKETKKGFNGIPIFLYGQSLGGNFIVNYVLRHNLRFAGVITSAPLFRPGFKPPAWKIILGKMMYHLWPTLTLSNGVDPTDISRDQSILQSRLEDTLCHTSVTPRFISVLDAGEWALRNAYRLDVPLLIMHGSEDRITSVKASHEFTEKAGALCTLKIWEGFFHSLHEEPEKEKIFNYLITWMKERIPQS